MKKLNKARKIEKMLSAGATVAEIMGKLKVARGYIYVVKQKIKVKKPTEVKGAKVANSPTARSGSLFSTGSYCPSPTTTAWLERNPWFGANGNEDKTEVALAVHEKVLRSGVAVNSGKYYARIDAQMRKYDKDMVSHPPHYKLTTSQMAVANELGVAKEAYAKELKKLDRENIVNHPPHYKVGGIEVIDFIEAKQLGYNLGNVVKYVSRAGKKDTDALQDLQKARWYLERAIQRAE